MYIYIYIYIDVCTGDQASLEAEAFKASCTVHFWVWELGRRLVDSDSGLEFRV